MINIAVIGGVALVGALESLIAGMEERWLSIVFLVMVVTLQLVGAFSCIASEVERCNIIHDRLTKQRKSQYRNFHQLQHCKESLLTVALYYLLNKLFLLSGRQLLACTFLPVVLLFPAYFTFVLNRRYNILKLDDKGKLTGTATTPMLLYIGFVAAVMGLCEFSVAMCLVVAQPLLKLLLGNVLAGLVHISACYSILLQESIGWSIIQLLSLAILKRALEDMASIRLYTKILWWLLMLHLIYPLWAVCYRSNHFVTLSDDLHRFCRSALFHFYLFYLLLHYLRFMGGNAFMSDTLTYYVQSFRSYFEDVSVDRGTLLAINSVQQPLCAFLLVLSNLTDPNSLWVFLFSAHLLVWNNQVAWNRRMLMLRLAILFVRDLPIFDVIPSTNGSIGFLVLLLQDYAKSPHDTGVGRLALNMATTRPMEDMHHRYLSAQEMPISASSYSLLQLMAVLLCILVASGSTFFPKRAKQLQKAMLLLYPMCWLATYWMLDRLDPLQLQAYGYLTAEVLLCFR